MHLEILLAMTSSYKSCTVLSNRKPYFTAIYRGKTNLHYFFPHFSCRSILAGLVFLFGWTCKCNTNYSQQKKKRTKNEERKKKNELTMFYSTVLLCDAKLSLDIRFTLYFLKKTVLVLFYILLLFLNCLIDPKDSACRTILFSGMYQNVCIFVLNFFLYW